MRLQRRTLAAASALIAFAGVAVGASAHAAGQVKLSNVTIVASDGVNLVGDVYLPSSSGKYPAVVDMEPYGRSADTQFVSHGYAQINTDVRGSGASGGALCLLCDREQQDVYDVVEWVAHQPWSNGHVALQGYSYSAITALLGAAKQPPHLDAVVVGHPPTDPYRDVVWQNGMFNQGFVYQWFAGQTAAQFRSLGPQQQILDRAQQEFAFETRLAPLYGPLYEERSVLAKMDKITVPVYVYTGWNDNYSRGDLDFIDHVASKYKLLYIDPSTHHGTGDIGDVGAPYGGGITDVSPALSAAPPKGEPLKWLDRFLKGVRNGIENTPRVRWFDLGDRTWHATSTWAAAQTSQSTMFLSGANSGTDPLSPNDGTLAASVPTGRPAYQEMYVYTPAAGVSTPLDKEGPDAFSPYATFDQRIDSPLGLTYTGPALTKPLHLAGPSELNFWALTEGSDMDWVARLIDVAPNGSASVITEGWLRASYRAVDESRSKPGAPYHPDTQTLPVQIGLPINYRVDIWDTAYTLAPGHRLRLWLSSSDTPNHEPLAVAGRNIVMHDATHPSQLILGTR
jgi:putative CocE/NonD family hydrolase